MRDLFLFFVYCGAAYLAVRLVSAYWRQPKGPK